MAYDDFMSGYGMPPGYSALSGVTSPLSGQPGLALPNIQMPQMPDLTGMATQQTAQMIADPYAGQSWWQKLIGGALVGLAGGAGAPDVGTAVAQGYQATMQKREADRQAILQAKQYEMQQKLYESKMMGDYIDQIGKYQKIQSYPKELQATLDQSMSQVLANMHQAGYDPVGQYPDEKSYMDAQAANGKPDIGNFHVAVGGQIFAFNKSEDDHVPDNYSVPFKNVDGSVSQIAIPANTKWSAVPSIIANYGDLQAKQMQNNAELERQRLANAGELARQKEANKPYYDQVRGFGAMPKPGALTDEQKANNSLIRDQINDVQYKMNKAQGALDTAFPEDKPAIQQEIDGYKKQLDTLTNQYRQNSEPKLPIGTVTKSGTIMGYVGDKTILKTNGNQLMLVDPLTGFGQPYTPGPLAAH